MARYAKQIDHFSCGPTAVINAIKWTGAPVSYRTMRKTVIEACQTQKDGTDPFELDRGVQEIFPSYGIIYRHLRGSCRGFPRHVRRGGAVIIRFKWPRHDVGHYVLITNVTRHFADVVNLYPVGPAKQRISRKTLNKLLVKRAKLHCWYLTKT